MCSNSSCAKSARVTTPSRSRSGPKMGAEASTTTAFWTVDLVASAGLCSRAFEAICRLHEMPKIVVGEMDGQSTRNQLITSSQRTVEVRVVLLVQMSAIGQSEEWQGR